MLLLYAGMYTTLLCNIAYPIPHLIDNKTNNQILHLCLPSHYFIIT